MRYLSVCSGVGSDHLAAPAHWQCAGFSEVAPFPRAVLAHRFPEVPLHDDFTALEAGDVHGPVDLLAGGPPCQSFSVAGRRGGLDDARGNLSVEFVRLGDRLGADWLFYENVPGLLSSGKGDDFGSILDAMVDGGVSRYLEGAGRSALRSAPATEEGLRRRYATSSSLRPGPCVRTV